MATNSRPRRPYLLTFWGGAFARLPRHRRWHETFEAASDEAQRILGLIDDRTAHPACIDGPGLGLSGRTVV